MLDTGCLMLVEDSVFSRDNKRESFENIVSLRGVGSTSRRPETSIQHRFVYCLKAILKLVSFVNFLGMQNG